jgi:hypothetical protein
MAMKLEKETTFNPEVTAEKSQNSLKTGTLAGQASEPQTKPSGQDAQQAINYTYHVASNAQAQQGGNQKVTIDKDEFYKLHCWAADKREHEKQRKTYVVRKK